MKIIKKTSDIRDLENIWINIDSENNSLTEFQTFSWNKILYSHFQKKKSIKKVSEIVFLVFETEKSKIIIVPLMLDMIEKEASIFGQSSISDYLDFIYSQIEIDDLYNVVEYLLGMYPDFLFLFDRINESSLLFEMLTLKYQEISSERKICAKIEVKSNMNYIHSLSKNSRQNYRTAVNRINKSNLTYEVSIDIGKVNYQRLTKLYSLYVMRRLEKVKSSIRIKLKSFIKLVVMEVLHRSNDVLSDYLHSQENSLVAYININGDLAAYFAGIYKGRVLYISRASISNKYKHFSPGVVCLIETVEKIRNDFDIIDLTRGDEKYKIQCGAKQHYNYLFKLKGNRRI